MSYTATEVVFIITGIITVITPSIISVLTAWRTSDKIDKVAETTNTIQTNTNGKLTKQDNQISALLYEVRGLTAHIASLDKDKAVAVAEAKVPPAIVEAVKTAIVETMPGAIAEAIRPSNGGTNSDIIIIAP